jgi:homoserine kinase
MTGGVSGQRISKLAGQTGLRLALPGTSANLGPGFDAAGLALSLKLTVEAHVAPVFTIHASGRNAELCGRVDGLLVETYRDVLRNAGVTGPELKLSIHNEIPLGMGCGSSAAALLAGVALADHFGDLGWNDGEIVEEASRREGHPDNVAACWYGGFTVSAEHGGNVVFATAEGDSSWEMMLAMPGASLATKEARALLPDSYSRADAVFNVQRSALLTAAFFERRLDLLKVATQDRMHQPYRERACGLLPMLLPLVEEPEIAAVTLSGAGPSVLVFLAEGVTILEAETRLRRVVGDEVELVAVRIGGGVVRTVV